MPTGYKALYPWDAPTALSDEDHNQVMGAMVAAICDSFLPKRGFHSDQDVNREEHELFSFHPSAYLHYFIPPRLIRTWVKGGLTHTDGVVFILGPSSGNPSNVGKQGVVIFCYCEHEYQIRAFWDDLAEFLEKTMPKIVTDLKLEVTA